MGECILVRKSGGGTGTLTNINVVSNPTKTTYTEGDTLDLRGLSVNANYGGTKDVTNSCTISPTNGTKLSTSGTNTVNVSYSEKGISKTTSFNIIVKPSLEIVTWAGGTDAQIAAMVAAADAGTINLLDYWSVGQERKVALSAMAATGVDESHVAQTVTMALMNAGGKTLVTPTASGRTTCSFIVGLKNGLANGTTGEYGYMNSSSTNTNGWDGCLRRPWCNNIFYNAIPSTLIGIFKQFKNVTANGSDSTTTESNDYFALPAEKEIFGTNSYANSTAETSLSQFTYYATSSNRIKTCGDLGSANLWWERSPYSGNSSFFCIVHSGGSAGYINANDAYLLAPFGCI